jgi:predicted MPP superfamily phosphohydrolase
LIWIFFHSLMTVCDLFVLVQLRRRPGVALYCKLFGLTWLVMLGLASICTLIIGDDPYFGAMFMTLGAVAQGIFIHGVILLLFGGHCLRSVAPRLARASLALGLVTGLAGYYAFWIEPTALEINHHRVESSKLLAPMRLVVLSDLQMEELGEYEKRALRAALAEEPDVLLLPGDFVHERSREAYVQLMGELNAFLRELPFRARLGIIAVGGNVDRPGWEAIFEGLEVRCFTDSGSVEWGGVHFSAVGFDDSELSDLRLGREDGFHVAVGHCPDYALGEVHADLLLAGHTHGGQVVLPFWGPPLTLTAVPREWASGRTEIGEGRTLIVSRGVGLERGYAPRLRFGSPPEIVVVDLLPAGSTAAE